MHVHEFAYVSACEHVCHRMRVYLSVYIHMRVSAWVRAWECVRIMCEHAWLCVCVHVYMRARVRASVRACVRAHVCS